MSNEQSSFATVEQELQGEEDMGYDVPFANFTWVHWLEMQAHMLQSFTRFQRTIEHRQAQLAMAVVLEMQEIVSEMQKEACSWIGINEKK